MRSRPHAAHDAAAWIGSVPAISTAAMILAPIWMRSVRACRAGSPTIRLDGNDFRHAARRLRPAGLPASLILGGFLSVWGCAGPPPVPGRLEPPEVTTQVRHFLGSPVSGPLGGPEVLPARADDALAVTVSFAALESEPAKRFEAITERARSVLALRGGEPILASPVLARGARVGTIPPGGDFQLSLDLTPGSRVTPLASLRGALPPDCTASFALQGARASGVVYPADLPTELQVAVHRPAPPREAPRDDRPQAAASDLTPASAGSPADIALILRGRVPGRVDPWADGSPDTFSSRSTVPGRELVILEPLDGSVPVRTVLLVPSPFEGTPRSIAALVEIAPPPSGEASEWRQHVRAFERCQADLSRGDSETAAPPPETPGREAIESSLEVLGGSGARQRTALLWLGRELAAPLTTDLALTAREAVVAGLADAVRAAMKESLTSEDPTRADLAWVLERTSHVFLAQQLQRRELPPELTATLLRRTGQVGRHANTILEVVSSSKGLEQFHAALVQENFIALQDGSPAARVRAFDWLARRGEAPPDYDPLAPGTERREALVRYEADREARGRQEESDGER